MSKRRSDDRQLAFDFVFKSSAIGCAVSGALGESVNRVGSVMSFRPRLVWVSNEHASGPVCSQLNPDSAEVTSMIRNAAKAIGW